MQKRLHRKEGIRVLDERGKISKLKSCTPSARSRPTCRPTTGTVGTAAAMPVGMPGSIPHDHGQSQSSPAQAHFSEASGPVQESKYQNKQEKVSQAWESLRPELSRRLLINSYPTTFKCVLCPEDLFEKALFRCTDCGPCAFFCHDCCFKLHQVTKVHTPQMWSEEECCYLDCDVKDKWYRPDGHSCDSTKSTQVIIIDHKGRQHKQLIMMCKCEPVGRTLLRNGLWPASPTTPGVAFTLDLMNHIRSLVLEGHISLKAICNALHVNTKDIDELWIKDIYRILHWETVLNFMFVYHENDNLTKVVPALPDGTSCLACPTSSDHWKRILSLDACFGLVQRKATGHSVRKPLHAGKFFLPQDQVDLFVSIQDDQIGPEDQTCSNFQAGSIIRSKNKTEKLKYTGVMASVCGHDFPDKILNLRHGERLSYPLFLLGHTSNVDVVMYDIGCRFVSHLKAKKIPIPPDVKFAIPIFHVHGHKYECQVQYSPRRVEGAGLADGEGDERLWSYLGNFRSITREQNSVNRSDLLTEALLWYGFRLNHKLGITLSRRLEKAYMVQESSKNALDEVLHLLPGSPNLDVVVEWTREEKELTKTKQKITDVDWRLDYSLQLHQYYTKCDLIHDGDLEEDDIQDKARFETILGRLERRHKFKRWGRTSGDYKATLESACHQQRILKLEQLRDCVIQYSYMISIRKKYARGQTLAKRISAQIQTTSKKVNVALKAYNSVPPFGPSTPPHQLERKTCIDIEGQIWEHLIPHPAKPSNIPSVLKRKAIDSYHLFLRSSEEIVLVKNSIRKLVKNIDDQINQLHSKKKFIVNIGDEQSLFDLGCLASINSKLKNVCKWYDSVSSLLQKADSSLTIEQYVILCDENEMPARGLSVRDVSDLVDHIQSIEEESPTEQAEFSEEVFDEGD